MTNNPKPTRTAYELTEQLRLAAFNECPTCISDALAELKRAVKGIIGVAPPCEPDCDQVRHAFHEGAYQLTLEQEKRLAQWLGETEDDEAN